MAVAVSLLAVGFVMIAPSATANNGCAPNVGVDANHAPAGEWSTHNHPRFTFPTGHCREVYTQISTSWDGTFNTGADSYHPTVASGEHQIHARTLYEFDHTHFNGYHCHLWIWGSCFHWHAHYSNHVHTAWTGWVASPTVKVDIDAPSVSISGISGPFVEDPGADYLTSDTQIHLSASDAHSGIDRVEWRVDGEDWATYDGAATIEGDDGEHTFTYRAVDNVGLVTEKSRTFILDNTGPEMDMVRPNANSVTFGDFALETCNGNVRITEAGATILEVPGDQAQAEAEAAADEASNALEQAGEPLPDPEDVETPGELDPVLEQAPDAPEDPEAPDVLASGPDICAGEVLETNGIAFAIPGLEDAQALVDETASQVTDELPETPEEIDPVLEQVPDAPEDPEGPEDPEPPEELGPVLAQLQPFLDEAERQAEERLGTLEDQLTPLEDALGPVLDDLPEAPEDPLGDAEEQVPDEAGVEAQDVDYTPVIVVADVVNFVLDVDDALVGTDTVTFSVDGQVLEGQANGDGEYTFTWDTTVVPAGNHEVTFTGTDRLGNAEDLSFQVVVLSTTPPEPPSEDDLPDPSEHVPEPPVQPPEPPVEPPEELPAPPEDLPGLPPV